MARKLQLAPHLLAELEQKYRLEEVIGAGGMGAVLRAYDKRLERRVAIKVKSVADAVDTMTTERFLFEARVMGRIDHPRLVKIFELGQAGSDIYLVCEYLPGGSLADKLEIHPFVDVAPACAIACDVLEGIQVLHEQKIVHRDLKPENILFGEDGRARVADLGLAKGGDREFETRPGLILGSLHYMSPEHFHGKPVGPAADLYAVGTVLFEMIAGRCPYVGETEAETIQMRLTRPAPRLREVQERCPAWLDAVVAQLLEKEPEDRHRSAADVIKVIRKGMKEPVPVPGVERSRTAEAPRRPRGKDSATRQVSGAAEAPAPASAPAALDATQLAPALKEADVRKPAKRARRARRAAMPALAVAGCALLTAFFWRRGPSGDLGMIVAPDRIEVTGHLRGVSDVTFILSSEPGRVLAEKEVRDPHRGLEISLARGPVTSSPAGELTLRVLAGGHAILEQPVPRLEGPWSFPQLGCFRVAGPAATERQWEAVLEGGAAPLRIQGVKGEQEVEFTQAVPEEWTRGSLAEVAGWPVAGTPEGDGALRVTRIGFGPPRSFPSRKELAGWIPAQLPRGSRKDADHAALLEEMFRNAFGRWKSRGEGEVPLPYPLIEKSLKRFLSPGGAPLAKQLELYQWLQPLLLAEAWARDWELEPPVDVSAVVGTFVTLDRVVCSRYEMQELHVLADFQQPNGIFTESLTMMARDGFVVRRFMMPKEEGMPPELSSYGDPSIYRLTADVSLQGREAAPTGDRVGLRISVMNLHRTFALTMKFDPEPGIEFTLANPTNWANLDNPTGPLTYPQESWSWKNIPQHSAHYQFLFRRAVFGAELPGRLQVRYVPIPGLKRHADRYAYLFRAEWFDPAVKNSAGN